MTIPPLYGIYGSSALPYLNRFGDAGCNAFWFHMFNPEAFDACHKNNIAACVEFKTFRADFKAHPDLAPIGIDGKPIRYGALVQGVCLSKKEFLDEIDAHLREGLKQFTPTGIWLDYLTYGGWFEVPDPDLQESCFCPACIDEFCQATGIDAETPTQILETAQKAWTRHKCERIARFAAHYAQIIRAAQPNCIIGAYMCPWTPREFDGALTRIFAQEYDLLAENIHVFTPLIYAQKSGRSPAWGREFLEASSSFLPTGRKVQVILDVLDFPATLMQTSDSSVPSWGLQLFGGSKIFENQDQWYIFKKCVEKIREKF